MKRAPYTPTEAAATETDARNLLREAAGHLEGSSMRAARGLAVRIDAFLAQPQAHETLPVERCV